MSSSYHCLYACVCQGISLVPFHQFHVVWINIYFCIICLGYSMFYLKENKSKTGNDKIVINLKYLNTELNYYYTVLLKELAKVCYNLFSRIELLNLLVCIRFFWISFKNFKWKKKKFSLLLPRLGYVNCDCMIQHSRKYNIAAIVNEKR